MTSPLDSDWHNVGPGTMLTCPICPHWRADQPPMEMRTEVTPDGDWRINFRQRSAVPDGLLHIVTEHPESEHAADILARVQLHIANRAA